MYGELDTMATLSLFWLKPAVLLLLHSNVAAKEMQQLTQDPNPGPGSLRYTSYYHYTITYLGIQC